MDKLLALLNGYLSEHTQIAKVFISGWKSFFLPAEPLIFPFNFTLTASQVLNNQAFDLKLNYDYYVYGIGLGSTGLFSFGLRATGGGVFFTATNVRSDTLWSANQKVLMLRRPFKILAGGSLTVDLVDLSAAGNTGQIVLLGWKAASQMQPG
jgi:hypothetical protein